MNEIINLDNSFEKHENKNAIVISNFEDWLIAQNLSKKTIKKHVDNIEFFLNGFLAYKGFLDANRGIDEINEYLGDWFIRKATWVSKAAISSNIASFKKFYNFMFEIDEINKLDLEKLIKMLKEDKEYWIENVEDDWEIDF